MEETTVEGIILLAMGLLIIAFNLRADKLKNRHGAVVPDIKNYK
jgi:hypothetical protein